MTDFYNSEYKKLEGISWFRFFVIILIITVIYWIISEPQKPFGDFTKAYYLAGQQILENPSSLYNRLNGNLTFVNIPIIALLFTPFSMFSKSIAVLIMTALGTLANLAACYLAIRLARINGWKRLALIVFFAANGPLYYNLKMGNTTQYVLLLLLGTIFCFRAKQNIWAGVLTAIAALIKLPFLLFGLYFVFRKYWHVLIGFIITLSVVLGTSFLLFGIDLHITWYSQCIEPYLGKPLAAFNIQSIDGFLARILTTNSLQNWTPIEVGFSFKLVKYLLVSLILGTAIWIGWKCSRFSDSQSEATEFSIVLCLCILLSPISWTHYYLVLLIPLALYLGNELNMPKGRFWSGAIIINFIFLSLPIVNFESNSLIVRILASHYFISGTFLMFILLAGLYTHHFQSLKTSKPNNPTI